MGGNLHNCTNVTHGFGKGRIRKGQPPAGRWSSADGDRFSRSICIRHRIDLYHCFGELWIIGRNPNGGRVRLRLPPIEQVLGFVLPIDENDLAHYTRIYLHKSSVPESYQRSNVAPTQNVSRQLTRI